MSDAVTTPLELVSNRYKLASIEPTLAMIEAAMNKCGPVGCCSIEQDHAREIWSAMLAASTPVGGWEEPVAWRYRDAWGRWAYCQAVDNLAGPKVITEKQPLYAAPPPPSVSTGSRPQEAVPTAQTVPAVVGWQDSETAPRDGRWLLLEGEMSGGDTSTVRVGRWNPTYSDATRCTYEWQCVDPYAHGTEDEAIGPDSFWNWYADGRVSGWQPLPQPAEGCSSNEGAGE
jgi:hypothetical protein